MPLTDDQKALLRLLAQREQGYEDIGALMGLSVGEVRERVREALVALNEEKGTTGRAAPTAEPPPPPAPAAAAPQPEPRQAPAPAPQRKPVGPPRIRLPRDPRRRFELAGGILIVVLLALFATGLVDIGGGGSSSSGEPAKTAAAGGPGASGKPKLTQAVLEPVGGGSASGRAVFGRTKQTVLLLVVAKGLEPSPPGRSYAISLIRSPSERVPIAATVVGRSGTISGQYQVAPETLGLLAGGFDRMEVALVSNATLKTALVTAKREGKAPSYGGTAVLSGTITGPIVNAAAKGKR
ncbi:MAG TPA: hypothetical protein VFP23_03470 [Solirubrobacterales bacterium]|nr:hypothetical protein [Solirubrobacterales bacterium]